MAYLWHRIISFALDPFTLRVLQHTGNTYVFLLHIVLPLYIVRPPFNSLRSTSAYRGPTQRFTSLFAYILWPMNLHLGVCDKHSQRNSPYNAAWFSLRIFSSQENFLLKLNKKATMKPLRHAAQIIHKTLKRRGKNLRWKFPKPGK